MIYNLTEQIRTHDEWAHFQCVLPVSSPPTLTARRYIFLLWLRKLNCVQEPDNNKPPLTVWKRFRKLIRVLSSAASCRMQTPSSPPIRSAGSWSTTWPRTQSGWGRACPDGNPRPGKPPPPRLPDVHLCSWHWNKTALATGWPLLTTAVNNLSF